MDTETARKLALGFEGAAELPHFELASFRIGKKIFATLDEKRGRAMIKLSPIEQSLFTDGEAAYPVPNKWGQQGATYFELEKVSEGLFMDALKTAYCGIAPKAMAEKYWQEKNTREK